MREKALQIVVVLPVLGIWLAIVGLRAAGDMLPVWQIKAEEAVTGVIVFMIHGVGSALGAVLTVCFRFGGEICHH